MSDVLEVVLASPALWLLLRVGLIAMFVILVTTLAERLGPFLGAMVASLPLYTGPVYFMLALQHDTAYLATATIGSLAICGATPVFALAYCVVARTRGPTVSLIVALAAWGICAAIVQSNTWSLVEALLFVAPIYVVSVLLAQGFTRGIAMRKAERRWTDLPLRAVVVASTAGCIIWASSFLPPQLTGIFSVLPVLMSSLIMILHPRIGGAATAALFAHTLGGLVGMVLAFALINLTIHDLGPAVSLSMGLVVTLVWNLLLIFFKKLASGRAQEATQPARRSSAPPRRSGTLARDLPPPRRPTAR